MGIDRITDLSQRILNLDPRVDGTPLRSLGWIEVAGAMGKLAGEGADLLRCMYLDDGPAMRRTVRRLEVSLYGSGALSEEMREALAFTAVRAFVMQRPCDECGGHGYIYVAQREELDIEGKWTTLPGEVVACGACRGEGVVRVGEDVVRDLLAVGQQVYDILLAEPYLDCYETLRAWHDVATATLSRQLR